MKFRKILKSKENFPIIKILSFREIYLALTILLRVSYHMHIDFHLIMDLFNQVLFDHSFHEIAATMIC